MHVNEINAICLKEFRRSPDAVERMKVGTANEVYGVASGKDRYIVRLSKGDSLAGSAKYIPLFRSLGISVPTIVAEDYSRSFIDWNYQIQTRLPGTDIANVISSLSEAQLREVAYEIASITKKLSTLPTDGTFGWVGVSGSAPNATWAGYWKKELQKVQDRSLKTGVVRPQYLEMFRAAIEKYREYLSQVNSGFYFDDMSSKNVLVNEGAFTGLVDLDGVAYGDYLEGIGRIRASWYGTSYGNVYSEAVMNELELSKEQRDAVTLYALLNRICWLSETGIQFNQNTSEHIDHEKILDDERVIDCLARELQL